MSDEDKGGVVAAAESVDGLNSGFLAGGVESVKRLVENEQFGILDESSGKEHKALLAGGKR